MVLLKGGTVLCLLNSMPYPRSTCVVAAIVPCGDLSKAKSPPVRSLAGKRGLNAGLMPSPAKQLNIGITKKKIQANHSSFWLGEKSIHTVPCCALNFMRIVFLGGSVHQSMVVRVLHCCMYLCSRENMICTEDMDFIEQLGFFFLFFFKNFFFPGRWSLKTVKMGVYMQALAFMSNSWSIASLLHT